MSVTHIAGAAAQVATLARQRCGWCGAVLMEVDLSARRVLGANGQPLGLPEPVPVGMLVEVEELADRRVLRVLPPSTETLPANACGRLDPAVTGSTREPRDQTAVVCQLVYRSSLGEQGELGVAIAHDPDGGAVVAWADESADRPQDGRAPELVPFDQLSHVGWVTLPLPTARSAT